MEREKTEVSAALLKVKACREKARLFKAEGDRKKRLDAVDEALWYRRLAILDRIEVEGIDPVTGWIRPRPCT